MSLHRLQPGEVPDAGRQFTRQALAGQTTASTDHMRRLVLQTRSHRRRSSPERDRREERRGKEQDVQRGDVAVGGAGDHPPAAGVDGVDVPVVEHVVVVLQLRLDGHQRHHCEKDSGSASPNLSSKHQLWRRSNGSTGIGMLHRIGGCQEGKPEILYQFD